MVFQIFCRPPSFQISEHVSTKINFSSSSSSSSSSGGGGSCCMINRYYNYIVLKYVEL